MYSSLQLYHLPELWALWMETVLDLEAHQIMESSLKKRLKLFVLYKNLLKLHQIFSDFELKIATQKNWEDLIGWIKKILEVKLRKHSQNNWIQSKVIKDIFHFRHSLQLTTYNMLKHGNQSHRNIFLYLINLLKRRQFRKAKLKY